MTKFYAHTLEGEGPDRWQTIEDHLGEVARLARKHAEDFASGDWGELAGRWHDLGKYAADFQDYLKVSSGDSSVLDASVLDQKPGRVDHSTAGAALVLERCAGKLVGDRLPGLPLALAMVIAGHHAGLPAWEGFEAARLRAGGKQHRLALARANAPAELTGLDLPPPPPFLDPAVFGGIEDPAEKKRRFGLRCEFWTRMLFSALIDADRLDTEAFTDTSKTKIKHRARIRGGPGLLAGLRRRIDVHLEDLAREKGEQLAAMGDEERERARSVLDLRAEVLTACRAGARLPPGRFSLTVPTGGGKTLASLAFALGHAVEHGLRRVIVVIPFTSIIDQTARAYREALGNLGRAVVEHHSNLDPKTETYHNRLASENWDAPVVVTTSVQFFESLYSRRGTAARKLHNIARSVVVFDEVQTLPHHLREPIFDALGELTDHYGASALLCTATQPALGFAGLARERVPALEGVREVVPDVPALFARVAGRVRVEFPPDDRPTTWEELAADVRSNRQALAIVHRRDDAHELCQLLGPDALHLSTYMCAAHRREVLARVVADLHAGRPCLVSATTLVEAGVDFDFPVVYRALGGADAMAQAAGRCNRNGRLPHGRLNLFNAPSMPPEGLRRGLETTRTLLSRYGQLDLFHPETFDRYFRSYLLNQDFGGKVTAARAVKDFVEVDEKFQMIVEDGAIDVVVPFGDAAARIEAYRDDPGRRTLRALQPFVVGVPKQSVLASRTEQVFETIHDQVRWLPPERARQYDPRFGLIVDEVVPRDPGGLIVAEV